MIIYKITNLINNKVYIGQTIQPLKKRIGQHFSNCTLSKYTNLPLYNAIAKYGKDNFKVDVIDNAITKEELNKKEEMWIYKLNSTNRNFGYNIARGGVNTLHEQLCVKIVCLNNNKQYASISEAARDLGVKDTNINLVLQGRSTHTKGYDFEYIDNSELNTLKYEKRKELEEKFKIETQRRKNIVTNFNKSLAGQNKETNEMIMKASKTKSVGYYITPAGTFHSSYDAAKANKCCQRSVFNRCHKITKKSDGWNFITK